MHNQPKPRKGLFLFHTMRNTPSGLISAIQLLAMGASMPGAPSISAPRFRNPSKRYPEQSSRQAMRGHRRAQGGPGIELNPHNFVYRPVMDGLWF